MAHRLLLTILAAGTLLLAAAPAGADAGEEGCGVSPASRLSSACGSASTSFDLSSIIAEIMQLQQQQAQAYSAATQAQLPPDDAGAAAQQAALAGSISSLADTISKDRAGALMAHVPDGGPLSGALAAQRP